MSIIQRVKSGARILDRKNPYWYYKVHPELLDLSNPQHCVLGQLYGTYATGLKEVLGGDSYANYFGFHCSVSERAVLKELWAIEVNQRLRRNKSDNNSGKSGSTPNTNR